MPPLPRVAAWVRAQRQTRRSARVCAGERAHERACARWGSWGFGHPLKPRETQSRHQRRRTPGGLAVNCVTVHKRCEVASTFFTTSGDDSTNRTCADEFGQRALSHPQMPSASVALAGCRCACRHMLTCTRRHYLCYSDFLLSQTRLIRQPSGPRHGRVRYWFSSTPAAAAR